MMDVDIDKSTPWVAAGDGNLDLMRLAINKMGLPPTAADPNGFTLVHAAAAYCRVDVLRYLLAQERVNPNAIDADGDTPLHHCDEMRAAIILIDEGKADPTIQNKDGKTARAVAEEFRRRRADRKQASERVAGTALLPRTDLCGVCCCCLAEPLLTPAQ